MGQDFPALPGFYKALFLYIEPFSTILPAILIWTAPGASWFHGELIPTSGRAPLDSTTTPMDDRTKMAIWQLGNCYFLLGLLSTFVFRTLRATLKDNPSAQERLLGASFLAMAIADVTHIFASFFGLPDDLQYRPGRWNATTHGNITFVIFLCLSRVAWFMGIGRKCYHYGVPKTKSA